MFHATVLIIELAALPLLVFKFVTLYLVSCLRKLQTTAEMQIVETFSLNPLPSPRDRFQKRHSWRGPGSPARA